VFAADRVASPGGDAVTATVSPVSGTRVVRRLAVLAAIVAVAAVIGRRALRTANPPATSPPAWPPIDPPMPASGNDPVVEPAEATSPTAPATPPADAGGAAWRPPLDDGSAPDGHPIKVKVSSGIYHVPGGRFYDRTVPDRCYPSEDAAVADGYRRSKT
jgi:hypothetical protein